MQIIKSYLHWGALAPEGRVKVIRVPSKEKTRQVRPTPNFKFS